jgi:hypothetical protein
MSEVERTQIKDSMVVFDDGSGFYPQPDELVVPPGLPTLELFVRELLQHENEQPRIFNSTVPNAIELLLKFLEQIHASHERARQLLSVPANDREPFVLYLRSFASAGMWAGRMHGYTRTDQLMQEHMADSLGGALPVVSALNMINLWPALSAVDQPAPPIVRLLNHNWRDVVGDLIKAAHVIVMFISGAVSEGAREEQRLINDLGQFERALFVWDAPPSEEDRDDPFRDHGFHWTTAGREWRDDPEAVRFAGRLRELAASPRMHLPPSPLRDVGPCHIVDRNIGAVIERLVERGAEDIDYHYLIPHWLAGNLSRFQVEYPAVLAEFDKVLDRARAGSGPGTYELANLMYRALHCFVLALTLELYEAMAHTLGVVAALHAAITRSREFHDIAITAAAKCAGWAGKGELRASYLTALRMPLDDAPPQAPRHP